MFTLFFKRKIDANLEVFFFHYMKIVENVQDFKCTYNMILNTIQCENLIEMFFFCFFLYIDVIFEYLSFYKIVEKVQNFNKLHSHTPYTESVFFSLCI